MLNGVLFHIWAAYPAVQVLKYLIFNIVYSVYSLYILVATIYDYWTIY